MQEDPALCANDTTPRSVKPCPSTTIIQVRQASLRYSGSSLLCRRQIPSHRLHITRPALAGCLGLHMAAMFQQQLDIRRRVIVSPLCKGQQSRLRPTTTPTPPSVLSIIYPDGRSEALIAANLHRQHAHAVGYGRRTCRNRICWPPLAPPLHGPQYIHHSAHTHQLFLNYKRRMRFLPQRETASAPPPLDRDPWA
jgi:hypothetical protein